MKLSVYPTTQANTCVNFQASRSAQAVPVEKKSCNIFPKSLVLSACFLCGGNYFASSLYELGDSGNRVESEQTVFSQKEDALEYAKNKVVSALNAETPFEYLVFVSRNNNILGEFEGGQGSVDGRLKYSDYLKMFLPNTGYTSIHGHPAQGGFSTPISYSDFLILNNDDNLDEVIAFNNKGEYSKLKKKKGFKPINPDKTYELHKRLWDDITCSVRELSVDKREPEPEEIEEYLRGIDGIKQVHTFWKENASKLNVEYETNYSYLK